MGIGTTIVTKIGIPLAIGLVAALILSRFKDPIISTLSSGAQTVGQAVFQPFAGFLGGVQDAFSNIPDIINLKLPEFNFGFGADDNKSSIAGETVVVGNDPDTQIIVKIPDSTVVNPDGTVSSDTPPIIVGGIPKPAPALVPVFKIQLSSRDPAEFLTFDQIVKKFGFGDEITGLSIVDFRNTEFRERIPVTSFGKGFFGDVNFLGSITENSVIGKGLALDPTRV